ncbi:MAG TPA: DMT family transporter [Cytophagaceae bacterium]|jgi:drug/metabolite transporter (DMT)-like permease|nr:DMT family transporter [Cytophagaceae bacterium]
MLLLTALIGGLNYTISKLVMPEFVKPLSIVVSRGIISIIVFSLVHFLFVKEVVKRKDYLRIFLAAFFGITMNQMMFYEGLSLTTPINASLMMTGTPFIVLLISFFVIKEELSFYKIVGIILGTTGTILLLLNAENSAIKGIFTGDILILINATSWAGFLVTVKPLMKEYNPFTILKWIFILGFIMIIPFGYKDFITTDWKNLTVEAWWAFAFVIIIATLLSYYINAAVMKYVDPSVAGSYIYLQPFIAAIVAIAWGKDSFSFEKLTYLTIIFLGVYLVSYKKNKTLE